MASTYQTPGIYIEEVNSGPRPIEGVGTAVAAFVGFAPTCPEGYDNKPFLVTNWSQYVKNFGVGAEEGPKNPHMDGWYMSHSVYGFFANGGGRCYITRINTDTNPTSVPLERKQIPSKTPNTPAFTLELKPGINSVTVEIQAPSDPEAGEGAFNLKVKSGALEESYENVVVGVVGRGPRNPRTRDVAEAVKPNTSTLIKVLEVTTTGNLAERMPEFGSHTIAPSITTGKLQVQPLHFIGDVSVRSGIEGFEIADDVTMVCVPDLMAAFQQGLIDEMGVRQVQTSLIAHCQRMQDRMAILDPLPNQSPQEINKWKDASKFDSPFAALYYPWLEIGNPTTDPKKPKTLAIPPSGHIAGIWARSDSARGVHKAPANEVILGVLKAVSDIKSLGEQRITDGEQAELNPNGVNCIRSFTNMGIRVWGARTVSSDPAWRYVNVRRLFNFVEKSIERGTQWVVFEPNDQDLWARVRRDVGAFLTGVWRDGALFGNTPDEAFFVKCDEETNPPDVRDRGQLIIEVGLAPVKPAEFVIFRFSQYAGGGA
jgi:uncharacterized protein